jgi:hypothetical protein
MAKLLEKAIATLREFPEHIQDMTTEALMHYLNELSTMNDRTSATDGRALADCILK